MMTVEIPMSSPDINEADVQAVVSVIRSGRLALGPQAVASPHALRTMTPPSIR